MRADKDDEQETDKEAEEDRGEADKDDRDRFIWDDEDENMASGIDMNGIFIISQFLQCFCKS